MPDNSSNLVRSFQAEGNTFDVPTHESDLFLKDMPEAKEIRSFTSGNDTFDIPFEKVQEFTTDMPHAMPLHSYGEFQQPEASQPKTYIQDRPEKETPIQKPIGEVEQPKEEGGFLTEMGKRATRGANQLNQMLVNTPNTFMRLVNAPFNELYEAVGLPKVNKDAFNQVTGLDQVDKNLDNNNEALTKSIDAINPKANISLVESAKQGDWGTFARNLAGGVVESMPTSIALMASAPATGAAAAVGYGSVMFGSSKLKEIDRQAPDMPEGLKLFTSYTNGALEGMFERYFGSGAVGGALNKLVVKEGKQAGQEVIKSGLREGFSNFLTKYPALAPFGEGYEEWATQVSQNYIDKVTGYKPDQNIFEGATDALLIGMASGGLHTLPIHLAQKFAQGSNSKQSITDSSPQLTVNPRQTKEAEIRQQAEGFASKTSGNIQKVEIIAPRLTDNTPGFVIGSFTGADGKQMFKVRDAQDETRFYNLTEKEINQVGEQSVNDFVNGQMGNYDKTLHQQELLKKNQIQVDGKQFILTGDQTDKGYVALSEDGSDIIIPTRTVDNIRNSGQQNANVITETYGKTTITGIKDQDGSISISEPSTWAQFETLKVEVEKATGGNAEVNVANIPNDDPTAPQQFQLSIVPKKALTDNQQVSENNSAIQASNEQLGAHIKPIERKITTQKFGATPIDFIEGEGFEEVVPNDKVSLEKALPILEKKFKDHSKFELQVEKSQVEIPGETMWDDPTFQTVIKSIKIVPKGQKVTENTNNSVQQNDNVAENTTQLSDNQLPIVNNNSKSLQNNQLQNEKVNNTEVDEFKAQRKSEQLNPGQTLPGESQGNSELSFDRLRTVPTLEEMKSKVDELQKIAPRAAPVILVHSIDELPEAIRNHNTVLEGINGVFYNGKVYIMAENVKSKDHLIATWVHENGIHHGIRNLLPANERRMLMNKVHDSFREIAKSNPEHKQIFNKVNWDYSDSPMDVRGEEMLAWLAQDIVSEKDLRPEVQSVWHQIKQYFRNLLSKLYGFDGNLLTEDQIDEIIHVSVQSNFQKP